MTYCVAMNLRGGIVGLADTLVTSGRETKNLRKVELYHPPGGAMFVMTSGLRSLRDKTLTYFEEELATRDEPFGRLFRAVNLLAAQVRKVSAEDRDAIVESGLSFNLHALIGGQMGDDPEPKLYMLYPQGNWVDTGRLAPYHIIGSTAYGKPLLDRALTYEDSLEHGFKVGCVSFDSTRISAGDVDLPVDVVLYRRDSFEIVEQRFGKEDLAPLSAWWLERIRRDLQEIPAAWSESAFAKLTPAPGEGGGPNQP